MPDRQPRLHLSADPSSAFLRSGGGPRPGEAPRPPVALSVLVPVGQGDREKMLAVPLDRRDLTAIVVAAGSALAWLDKQEA